MDRRKRIITAVILLSFIAAAVSLAGTGWPIAAYRYLHEPEQVVEVTLIGIACGSHLQWNPQTLSVGRGSKVRFVNTTNYWTVPVKVISEDGPGDGEPVTISPPLRPGESWTHTFWKPGKFFVTSAEAMQQWAGLQGWLTVK